MKTLYIECNMGAAGDMLLAALLELSPEPDAFIEKMNSLGIPKVKLSSAPSRKCGIVGTSVTVTVDEAEEQSIDIPTGHKNPHGHISHHHIHGHEHEHHNDHHHSTLAGISSLIGSLPISGKVKSDATAIYNLIAEAEGAAHAMPVDQIHFHEVGMMDAVADIVGVCLLMEELGAEKIIASPVHVGCGQVQCAHGVLPVPAPATAYILKNVPCYGGEIDGELCTPTGAALLKHFADDFGAMPVMKTARIGYGMGKKDFSSANCVRVFWGEA